LTDLEFYQTGVPSPDNLVSPLDFRRVACGALPWPPPVALTPRMTTKNTNFPRNPTCPKPARRMRACKVFGRDRTKMFHVKHFGTIARLNRTKFRFVSKAPPYLIQKSRKERPMIPFVMAWLDPAIQSPKPGIWMPGSRPGMTGESFIKGLGISRRFEVGGCLPV
jgi:hypothetical protein